MLKHLIIVLSIVLSGCTTLRVEIIEPERETKFEYQYPFFVKKDQVGLFKKTPDGEIQADFTNQTSMEAELAKQLSALAGIIAKNSANLP